MKKLILAFGLGLMVLAPAVEAGNIKTFMYPKNDGYRLDWCYNYAQGCGKKAAKAFCKTKGFLNVVDWAIDKNIGAVSTTKTLGDKRLCDKNFCDGFKFITCKNLIAPPPPPPCSVRKTFKYPKIRHLRVDWCYNFGQGCGKKAANKFCKLKGYTKALNWKLDPNIGLQSTTFTLGDHRYCEKAGCGGFKFIKCIK